MVKINTSSMYQLNIIFYLEPRLELKIELKCIVEKLFSDIKKKHT